MTVIGYPEQFERWLEGKPVAWSQILALRAALRVLPFEVHLYDRWSLPFRLLSACFSMQNFNEGEFETALKYAALQYPFEAAAKAAAESHISANKTIEYTVNTVVLAANIVYNEVDRKGNLISSRYLNVKPSRAIWKSVEDDCNLLESMQVQRNAARNLIALPLWQNGKPKWFDDEWSIVKHDFSLDDNTKYPLLDWYQKRVDGSNISFCRRSVADLAVQLKIFEQEGEFWEKDFHVVNVDIQNWIDLFEPFEPEIPPQRPGEVQTIIRDGRLAIEYYPPAPIEPDQDARRQKAWRAIRDALDDYAADGPTDNHPRLNRMIERLSAALGAEFAALNPVGLGVQAQYLVEYARRADEFLIADRAADLVALNITVGALLPRFPEWQAYLDDQDVGDVAPEALGAAAAVVEAIAQHDVAEPELNAKLGELVADARDEAAINDPDVPKLQVYAWRLLGGLGNVLATAGRGAVDFAKECVVSAGKGIKSGIEKGMEGAILALFGLTGQELLILAGSSPHLAWLTAVVAFLKKNAPKS